jgi:uncharacterized protein YbjQ (UPF0145 family)
MTKMRVLTLVTAMTVISAAALSAQQLRTLVTYTFGNGSATEADRNQALDEATQNAQNWANSACIGTVTNTNTTSSSCIKTGSEEDNNAQYTCMVSVKAQCETQYRGR